MIDTPLPPDLVAAGSLLDSQPPAVTLADAEAVAARYFGVVGVASTLSAERDCNFRLTTAAGSVLLKVSNPVEDEAAIEAQTLALLHIAERDPGLPVPRVLPTLAGEPILIWEGRLRVRMLTFLPGRPLDRAAGSVARQGGIGRLLARLGLALRDFDHVGARRPLLWDLTGAGALAALLPYVADPERRALAGRFLEAFDRHVAPVLGGLRQQVLHNDFNPHNLLAEPEAPAVLTGVIDFGDMVHAALVNDVATAAAYDIVTAGHPLERAGALVAGYHAVNPLQREEVDMMFDLIATRQVMSATINNWLAQRHPENRDYLLRNNQAAWAGLARFASVDRAEAQAWFRHQCGMI